MQNYIIGFLLPTLVMFASWILRAWLAGDLRVSVPNSVRPAAELAFHIITGSLLFALVFSAAAGINFIIEIFAQRRLAPEWIVTPTHILEAVVWGGDMIAFLLFTAVQLYVFCRAMMLLAKGTQAASDSSQS